MPSCSATERAAIWRAPPATSTSQPSAAAGTAANWVATVPSIIACRYCGVACATRGPLADAVGRSTGPIGTTSKPSPVSQS